MEGASSDSSCGVPQNINHVYYNDADSYLEHSLHKLHKSLLDVLDEDCVCYCDECWRVTSQAPQPAPSVSLSLSHSSYSVVTDNKTETIEDQNKEDEPTETKDGPRSRYPNIGHWVLESSVVNRSYAIQDRFVEENVTNEIDRSWNEIKSIWNSDVKKESGWGDVETNIETVEESGRGVSASSDLKTNS